MSITISPIDMKARRELGIKPGDSVRVSQKIKEKGKTRLQVFEGLVLGRKHGNEAGATFTVRRTASGVGVERIFPLYSPLIEKIEIIKRAKVRRAKLNYIRDKAAKEVKRQLRRAKMEYLTTEIEEERQDHEEVGEKNGEAIAKGDNETPEENTVENQEQREAS